MPRYFGNDVTALSELQVEACGHTEYEFLCCYRYKDEYEPMENKTRYPDREDRCYESYMHLSTITAAKISGVDVDIHTHMGERLEWNNKHRKYVLQEHVFDRKEDYYAQLGTHMPAEPEKTGGTT